MGDLLKNISRLCITMSSIPYSQSVVINVPVARQQRGLERIQCVQTRLSKVVNGTISQECVTKNAN